MNFDQAFEHLLAHEGGHVNDARDAGGETNFGISRRAYPSEDIAGMTRERAKELYLRDYWGPAGCDTLPDGIRFSVFDAAVNSGPRTAIVLLQTAVGALPDGVLGPRTLMSVNGVPPERLFDRFNGYRLQYLTKAPGWPAFSRGWARRVANNLIAGV